MAKTAEQQQDAGPTPDRLGRVEYDGSGRRQWPPLLQKGILTIYRKQYAALFMKSYFSMTNNRGMLCTLFFLPIFFMFLLEAVHNFENKAPEVVNFHSSNNTMDAVLPECFPFDVNMEPHRDFFDLKPCVQILWGPAGHPFGEQVMRSLGDEQYSGKKDSSGEKITTKKSHYYKSKNVELASIEKVNSYDELFKENYRNPAIYDT